MIGRMKAAWSRIVGSTRKEVVGWSQASFGVAGMLGLDKLDGLASPYAQNAWVFSGVSMKADALSDAPFRIYTGDVSAMDEGKAVPDTDEYAKMFAMPDPRHDSAAYWGECSSWSDLEGEFIAVAFADGSRFATRTDMIRELLLVNPRCVMEEVNPSTNLVNAYTISDGSRTWRIPAESVWHWKRFNPLNPNRGMSRLQSALLGMQGTFRGDQFVRAQAQNEALPGLIVKVPDATTKDKRADLREQWESRHRGADKAGRVAIISNNLEVIPLERSTFKETGLETLKTWSRDEIAAVLGLSKWDFGLVETTTYGSAQVLDSRTWKKTIIPWMRSVQSSLRRFMGDRWMQGRGAMWGAFDTSAVEALQVSLGDRLDNAAKMTGLGYGQNEVNERLGLGMEDVPDEVDTANTFEGAANGAQLASLVTVAESSAAGKITPEQAAAIIAIGMPGIAAEQAAAVAGEGGTYTEPEPNPTPIGGDPRQKPSEPGAKPDKKPDTKALTEDAEREIYHALGTAFRVIKSEVLARVRSADRAAFAAPKAWTVKANPVADLVGSSDLWRAAVRTQIGPAVVKVTRIVARDANLELQASERWDSPAFRKAASKRIAQMVDLAPKYRKKLATRITSVIRANGFDVRAVEDMIDAEFGQYVTTNAETIARTEVGMLREGIRHTIATDAGYMSKVWQTILDGSERPSHEATHAERVGISDTFSNGLKYPLEAGAPADEVINCRCRARYQKRKP